jgi:thioredoxin-dependent peroxiredoxin
MPGISHPDRAVVRRSRQSKRRLGLRFWFFVPRPTTKDHLGWSPLHSVVFSGMLKERANAAGNEGNMASIQVGDGAPDFTAQSHTGQRIALADYRGRQAVVVFFYPKDGTPVCSQEACTFRDAYEDFVQAGAVVIGVSADSAESHRAFAAGQRLPFILLADEDGSLRKAFGVAKTLGIFPGRVTYVIDKQGVVRHVFSSQLSAKRHVAEALETVRQLASSQI